VAQIAPLVLQLSQPKLKWDSKWDRLNVVNKYVTQKCSTVPRISNFFCLCVSSWKKLTLLSG